MTRPNVYRPAAIPRNLAALPAHVDRELHRIADHKEDRHDTVLFSLAWSDTITIAQSLTWQHIFDASDTPDVVYPPDIWQTGLVVAPQAGIYLAMISIYVEDISGAGNRNYEIGIGAHINWTSGPPVYQMVLEQEDDKKLAVSGSVLLSAARGDTIDPVAYGFATQFTHTADIQASVQIWKIA